MEDQRFDELAKRLAAPVSRRTAMMAGVATAVGGIFALGANSNVASADDCKGNR